MRLDEERRKREELCSGLEKELDELRMKLKDSTTEICRLEAVLHDKKEKAPDVLPTCGPRCSHMEEELHQTRSKLARIQEEAERQRDRQQREITTLKADKHRLEERC